ncbi:MAG: HNH endonuclease signature motif containing protein [Candidatus Thiodiazotropha sp.]
MFRTIFQKHTNKANHADGKTAALVLPPVFAALGFMEVRYSSMAINISDDDEFYQQWLRLNPEGYVLSLKKSKAITYMSLHRSICSHISVYDKRHPFGAFTERAYMKVCANSINEIESWIKDNTNDGKITLECSHCNPRDNAAFYMKSKHSHTEAEKFEKEVELSKKRTSKERMSRLSKASSKPTRSPTISYTYNRNPDVVAEVLNRAKGICENCGKSAPFIRASDNTPYLEVHHKKQLSHGGEDTVKNAIALCPNCHRESHYGKET